MSSGVFVVRQNAENPVIFVDIFIFDKFKSRDSPFLVNLGFLEAVFLQPLWFYYQLAEHMSNANSRLRDFVFTVCIKLLQY